MEINSFQNYVKNLKDDELAILRATVEKELAERGLVFSVGELGEKYAISYFNSTPGLPNLIKAPTGAKNVDALSRDGDRYSIKATMKAKKTGTVYPDDKHTDKQLFEYLVLVRLNDNYQLDSIYRYSWEDFVKVRAWDKRMNSWYINVSMRNLQMAEKIYTGK